MPKPWNKINIPKDILGDLYENQGLSIAKIALELGCSTTPIHRLLREYQIRIRIISEAKEKFKISKQELKNLYLKQKLSTEQIAQRYDCSHATIVNRMKKYGIKSRGHLGLTRPIRISKEKLEYLYYTRRLSLVKIAKILHCSASGLERKMKNFKIKTRPISQRACKHKKKNFDGSLTEKAYMIGFRLGDLNVCKSKNVIVVRCSSTKRAQISLIKNLFSPYGGISTSKAKRGTYEIYVFLDQSFKFLLPKEDKISNWIIKSNKYFLAFFAGYSDAEGSLYLHKTEGKRMRLFAVFELNSYDKNILQQLRQGLKKINIDSMPLFISSPKGTPCGSRSGKKYFSNGDAWCFVIARKALLWRLIHFWKKYSRHKDKKRAINKARENLIFRNQLPYCRKIDLTIPKMP